MTAHTTGVAWILRPVRNALIVEDETGCKAPGLENCIKGDSTAELKILALPSDAQTD